MKVLQIHKKIWENIISTTSIDNAVVPAYRKIYVIFFLLFFIPHNTWLAEIPDALYNPPRPSLAVLFNGFPGHTFLFTTHIMIIIGLVLVGINRFSIAAGVITFLLILTISNFQYSLGKIDHTILLPIVLLCFSLNNWNAKQSSFLKLPIPPETLLAIFIGFGMFTAGFQKGLHWIDFDLNYSGFLSWFYPGYFILERKAFLAPFVFHFPPILIELLDYAAVIFELSAILILFTGRKLLWKIWLLTACLFHILNLLLLNISFTVHTLVYLPYLLPLGLCFRLNKYSEKTINRLIITLGLTQILLLATIETPLIQLLSPIRQGGSLLGLTLWVLIFGIGLYALFFEPK